MRHLRLAPPLVASLFAAACGPGLAPGLSSGALPVRVDCLAGLVASGDGKGCVAPEPTSCPKGSAAFFGEAACTSVGARCPAGFVADASGFGCLDAHEGGACSGATRESPTQAGCVPIGDCAAPFPPAEATLFVDDDFATVDATHFRSIAAAAHRAPTGSVIAVEAGTYAEAMIDPLNPVTIIGRCAEQVRVTGAGGSQVALNVIFIPGVVVRGLTLTGHVGGVLVTAGELTLEDSVVEGNTSVGAYAKSGSTLTVRRSRVSGVRYRPGGEMGAGLAANSGGSLVLEDSAVTDNDHRSLLVDGAGSSATVQGSYLGRSRKVATLPDEAGGVLVANGATLELVGSAVVDSDGIGLAVHGSTATVRDSVVRTVHGRYADNAGLGVLGRGGADLRIASSTLADAPVVGLALDDASTALVEDSAILGPAPGSSVEIGRGAQVTTGAVLTLRRSAVVGTSSAGVAFQSGAGQGHLQRVLVQDTREIAWDNPTPYGGFGLLVEDGSRADAELLTVEGATQSAIQSSGAGSVLTVQKTLLRGTRSSSTFDNGRAVLALSGGHLELASGRLVDHVAVAVSFALGATGSLENASVTDTRLAPDGRYGYGVAVTGKASLTLSGVQVARNPGVGLVTDDSQAWMTGGELRQNGVAVHAQINSFLSQSDAASPLGPGELRVSSSTQFVDNVARVGVGVMPMPSVK